MGERLCPPDPRRRGTHCMSLPSAQGHTGRPRPTREGVQKTTCGDGVVSGTGAPRGLELAGGFLGGPGL